MCSRSDLELICSLAYVLQGLPMLASVQQHFSNVEYKIILILILQNQLTEQQLGDLQQSALFSTAVTTSEAPTAVLLLLFLLL